MCPAPISPDDQQIQDLVRVLSAELEGLPGVPSSRQQLQSVVAMISGATGIEPEFVRSMMGSHAGRRFLIQELERKRYAQDDGSGDDTPSPSGAMAESGQPVTLSSLGRLDLSEFLQSKDTRGSSGRSSGGSASSPVGMSGQHYSLGGGGVYSSGGGGGCCLLPVLLAAFAIVALLVALVR